MALGSLLMALSEAWAGQVLGRLVAGVGGVLLSVLLSNMVADWFSPREIATAMAMLMLSWPVGLALSLMIVPAIGEVYGVAAAHAAVSALGAFGSVLLAAVYRARHVPTAKSPANSDLEWNSVIIVLAAAIAWSLFNVGYGMILGFGPTMLVERGWSVADAGSRTSLVIWLGALSTLVGGVIADRTKRYSLISIGSYLGLAFLLFAAPRSDSVILAFVALGIVSGLPVASVVSVPVRLLAPGARPLGLGLFYTIFYGAMLVGPGLGGSYAQWSGMAAAAFDFGAAAVFLGAVTLCVLAYLPRSLAPAARAAS
jgi:predicted MFS family arabinose efflux permease